MSHMRRLMLIVACVFGGAGMVRALPEEAETCLACHDGETAVRPGLMGFDGSAHAAFACTSCHAAAAEVPHPQKPLVDCGQCHAEAAALYQGSIHGQAWARGVKEAPACHDCHGEHTIRPPSDEKSSVSRGAISKTCSGCHESEKIIAKFELRPDRVTTFQSSFHGLASRSGDLHVANCASCHGWHDVLPSSDAQSRIHPEKLSDTCGRCHPGAGVQISSANVHAALSGKGGNGGISDVVRIFYFILIPLVLLGMLFHNAADWCRKATFQGLLPPLREEEDVLLSSSERMQHAVLALSFILLAYSGFALKYSSQWWALPMSLLGEEGRRIFHRSAAVSFVTLALWHAGYLFFTSAGRARLRALWPRLRDVTDALRLVRFNLGISKDRPRLERFSYLEKMEYWALVWGSIVMVATGAILVFHNFALANYPLWVIETARVIHYLEAVLACLAILVWHFYWVIYDPEVYPMNWAWLTGRLHRKKEEKNGQ